MKKKVLYILNNAPLYRETFLRELSKEVDLKVLAGECSPTLKVPNERLGYKYEEYRSFSKIPIQLSYKKIISALKYKPEVIILGWNLHDLSRYLLFFLFKIMGKKVVFSGLFYSRNTNKRLVKLRRFFLNKTDIVLAYSDVIRRRLINEDITAQIISFNNNDINNFYTKDSSKKKEKELNIAYIGRQQERKKIERLVQYATYNTKVILHLIGPGMSLYEETNNHNIIIKEEMYTEKLTSYLLEEIDLISIPGPSGLLSLTAAQHGIPLLIDKNSNHGPEIAIAYEAQQTFTDWTNFREIDKDITNFYRSEFRESQGLRLQGIAKKKYNINYMVNAYKRAIEE